MKKSVSKNKILATTSAVTVLSVAERGLGFLYRIVLSRLIGAEGIGLYQVALSLFSLFLTIGTGGIPITVSRMISKSKAEHSASGEKQAVSAGLLLSLLLTLPFCIFLLFFGDKLTFLFSDPRSFSVFRILLLGLCFSSIYAVIRGSFWGNKRFLLPSFIEIAEESVMVIVGIFLLQKVSTPLDGAQKAAWAVVISYLFSFAVSTLCFFFQGGALSSPKAQLKPLFNATMPITSVRASSALVNSAVAVLLPVMLIRIGYDSGEALTLFGVVSGMVLPILFIPSTIIGSLALVLVPELSEDYYSGNFARLKKNVQRGLSVSLLIACALIPFFFVLGEQMGALAYSNLQAGTMISKSSPLLLPISLTMISTSMLNSMGREKQTFLFYFIGAAALLLCVWFLPAVCGIYAYLIGMGASFLLTGGCNLIYLWHTCLKTKKSPHHVRNYRILIPIIAILPISLLGNLCKALFAGITGEILCLFLTGLVMTIVTLILYFVLGLLPNPFAKNKKKTLLS